MAKRAALPAPTEAGRNDEGEIIGSPNMPADAEPGAVCPWSGWTEPTVTTTPIHNVLASHDDDGNLLLSRRDGGDPIGRATTNGLRELSTRIGFPVDFVKKLEPGIQAAVIADRIRAARKQEFSFVVVDGEVTNVAPGWRDAHPHAAVAEAAYGKLRRLVDGPIEVERAEAKEGMSLRLLTPVEEAVTPQVGDVLRMGVEVEQRYGMHLGVGLYTSRLVCTNGMTATHRDYSWMGDASGTRDQQMEWLLGSVRAAVESYRQIVEQARRMAGVRVEGDPLVALAQRARALGIPRRLDPALVEAFYEEPGDTEWAMTNVLTRFAAHRAEPGLGRRLQRAAGSMTASFRMVTARLPLSLALKVGGQIIEAEPATADLQRNHSLEQ
jgi:hypothetical protein